MNKQLWMETALQQGIEEFEIYEQKSTSTSIGIFQGNVDSFNLSECAGISLRGLYKGKMGLCFLEDSSDDNMQYAIHQIIENAQTITSDDEVSIQQPQSCYPQIKERKNTCVDEKDDKKIQLLLEIERQLLAYDKRIEQVMGTSYSEVITSRSIINSKGMNIQDENSISYIAVQVMVKDKDDVKNDYEYQYFHDLNDVHVETIVQNVADRALSKLHASPIASGVYPVLMKNSAMADMFMVLSSMFSGENAYKGVSILKDKLNKKIFADCIHIMDDALLEDGLNSLAFDDEGNATQRTTLVEHGVLKSYLHNTKSAKLLNTKTTGNGFKGGYASRVDILPTNLMIANGEHTYEEMVESIDKGVIITDITGLHAGLNPISTDFSIQSEGFYVEQGKIVKAVNLITIAGNYMDMMKHIDMLGNDGKANSSGFVTPSILFHQLTISGE